MNDRRSVEQKLDGGEERTLLRHISPCLFFSAIIAELLARAKRARGRSPIANVIYPSQKIW